MSRIEGPTSRQRALAAKKTRPGTMCAIGLEAWKPQIVLQDLLLPGGMNGIDTTRRIVAQAPSVRVIALTASVDEARLMGVLRAGASGYVRKDAEPETLVAAVRAVAHGRTYIDAAVGRQLVATAGSNDLIPRENEVLRHLAQGLSNRVIAAALGDETVTTHVANLLAKRRVRPKPDTTYGSCCAHGG